MATEIFEVAISKNGFNYKVKLVLDVDRIARQMLVPALKRGEGEVGGFRNAAKLYILEVNPDD